MHFASPAIETPRLLLTWPSPDQVEGYYRAILGTNIFDTLIWDGPSSVDELHAWWETTRQRDPADLTQPLNLAVIERSSNLQIGGMSWRPVNGDPEIVDIGYAFAPAWHNRGLGTEAVGAMIDACFVPRRAERITANAFVGNDASRRLLEKLGFTCEGVMRRSIRKRGEWKDQWLMALTRPDWESRRGSTPRA